MGHHEAPKEPCAPFLKWAGGKRWLAPALTEVIRAQPIRHFVEPFVGSGALFFSVAPNNATLGDVNGELVNAYHVLKTNSKRLIDALARLKVDRALYDEFRWEAPETDVGRAVRFIYLNRTAFNGLWRVNRAGAFNVPFGCKPETRVLDEAVLRSCAAALQGIDIKQSDFRGTIRDLRRADLVYLDPPYTLAHENNGFVRYNERLFSWRDQVELAESAAALVDRGVFVLVTNAKHASITDLYSSRQFVACCVQRQSRMAATAQHRVATHEVVFVSRNFGLTASALSTRFSVRGVEATQLRLR